MILLLEKVLMKKFVRPFEDGEYPLARIEIAKAGEKDYSGAGCVLGGENRRDLRADCNQASVFQMGELCCERESEFQLSPGADAGRDSG